MPDKTSSLRIGQFSAYYGDRGNTFRELLDSDVDVLTGDYLAELTMLVLTKVRERGGKGYAEGFIGQITPFLAEIAERGVKVVTNAGGLDPEGCAQAIRDAAQAAGVKLSVASVLGDNVLPDFGDMAASGETFMHLDERVPLDVPSEKVIAANAYLGAWPLVEALEGGADIVICPRVTDASLIVGPAAWHFDWKHDDYDQLAGALWAGHAIECGAQVSGGNFSLFTEFPDLGRPGMPIAEITSDGSSRITKAHNTGGVVTVDTVKAQLYYEVGSADYHNPDVIAHLSAIAVSQVGPDLVAIENPRGSAPTDSTKLSLSYEGGYKNTMIVGITGAHVEQKLRWLKREVERSIGPPESFDSFRYTVIGPTDSSGGTLDESTTLVFITARDCERRRVSRAGFADPIVQLGVSNIPGYYMATPPQKERSVGVQWPCLIPKETLDVRVKFEDRTVNVPWPAIDYATFQPAAHSTSSKIVPLPPVAPVDPVLFGDVFGTRSGDKGGLANLGVWGSNRAQYEWLLDFLTVERLASLLPDLNGLDIHRYEYPRLHGVNFIVRRYLEDGVSSSTRLDAQAKGLGEFLGSRLVDIPAEIRRPTQRSMT